VGKKKGGGIITLYRRRRNKPSTAEKIGIYTGKRKNSSKRKRVAAYASELWKTERTKRCGGTVRRQALCHGVRGRNAGKKREEGNFGAGLEGEKQKEKESSSTMEGTSSNRRQWAINTRKKPDAATTEDSLFIGEGGKKNYRLLPNKTAVRRSGEISDAGPGDCPTLGAGEARKRKKTAKQALVDAFSGEIIPRWTPTEERAFANLLYQRRQKLKRADEQMQEKCGVGAGGEL